MPSPSALQVFAVRRKLVELLEVQTGTGLGLEDVKVHYGWPGDDNVERQMIYTDARALGTQEPASMRTGRTYYDEDAELDVTVRVEAVGGDQEEADTTCEALCLELARVVADNRTLGGLVNWVRMRRWVNTSAYNDQGYLAMVTYTLGYNARLN